MDALIERTMREIVGQRRYPATACPSEIPRRLEARAAAAAAAAAAEGDPARRRPPPPRLPPWRELMEPTREVARRLAREGALQVTQRGQVVVVEEDLDAPIRGPIRLRAMPP